MWNLSCVRSGIHVSAHWPYCEVIWAGMSLTEGDKRLRVSKNPYVKALCSLIHWSAGTLYVLLTVTVRAQRLAPAWNSATKTQCAWIQNSDMRKMKTMSYTEMHSSYLQSQTIKSSFLEINPCSNPGLKGPKTQENLNWMIWLLSADDSFSPHLPLTAHFFQFITVASELHLRLHLWQHPLV